MACLRRQDLGFLVMTREPLSNQHTSEARPRWLWTRAPEKTPSMVWSWTITHSQSSAVGGQLPKSTFSRLVSRLRWWVSPRVRTHRRKPGIRQLDTFDLIFLCVFLSFGINSNFNPNPNGWQRPPIEVFSSIPGGSVAPVLGYQVDSGHPTGQTRSLRSSRTNCESLYNNRFNSGI